MPTTRRTAPGTLTIPADIMRQLGWSASTPLDVQCHVAWAENTHGQLARCLTFTLTAAVGRIPRAPRGRRPSPRLVRKAA